MHAGVKFGLLLLLFGTIGYFSFSKKIQISGVALPQTQSLLTAPLPATESGGGVSESKGIDNSNAPLSTTTAPAIETSIQTSTAPSLPPSPTTIAKDLPAFSDSNQQAPCVSIPKRRNPPAKNYTETGADYLNALTYNGLVRQVKLYFKEANNQVFNKKPFTEDDAAKIRDMVRKKSPMGYSDDPTLHKIFADYPDMFRGKHIVIPGSEVPRYEVLLHMIAGVGRTTTLEYRVYDVTVPGIHLIHVNEYWKSPQVFDGALSWSNFEHDGLGRYGDPLDPEGDFKAMAELWSMIKCGGYAIVAIPTGMDCLVFNAHRVYGRLRWPKMVRGWKVVDGYPKVIHPLRYARPGTCKWAKHGIVVLQRQASLDYDPIPSMKEALKN
eukprot:PhF_6_TR22338/c0_g1_i1/m.31628